MMIKSFTFISALCSFCALLSGCASTRNADFQTIPEEGAKVGEQEVAVAAESPPQPAGTSPVAAGNPDELGSYKKERDEFKAASQAAFKKQMGIESVQRDLDKLTEQKQNWQREIIYARSRATVAKEKLNHAMSVGDQAQIEKFRNEKENWETRHKAAVIELDKTQAEIHDVFQRIQDSFKTTSSTLIMPGESIEVFVKEDNTLNKVYQVRQGGHIFMDNVGKIMLAGKDLAGAEQAIKEALAGNNYLKNATVMVDRPDSVATGEQVIYLTGEFVRPGAWKIPVGVTPTVVTALVRNPYKENADLTKVRLLRIANGQPVVEEVNVQAILRGAGQVSDLTLRPGDIVMIPAFANVVYVTGNVVRPGALKLLPDDELTAYSAILRSGGFARFANRSKVYVVRDMGNGQKQQIPLNIKDIQKGKGSDIILKSKDIVVVPEKFFSF